jgi:hypothetical protein
MDTPPPTLLAAVLDPAAIDTVLPSPEVDAPTDTSTAPAVALSPVAMCTLPDDCEAEALPT